MLIGSARYHLYSMQMPCLELINISIGYIQYQSINMLLIWSIDLPRLECSMVELPAGYAIKSNWESVMSDAISIDLSGPLVQTYVKSLVVYPSEKL